MQLLLPKQANHKHIDGHTIYRFCTPAGSFIAAYDIPRLKTYKQERIASHFRSFTYQQEKDLHNNNYLSQLQCVSLYPTRLLNSG